MRINRWSRIWGAVLGVVFSAGCAGTGNSLPAVSQQTQPVLTQGNVMQSCATLLPGDDMRCFAQFRTDVATSQRSVMSVSIAGYSPATLDAAYKLPIANGSSQTVAIVDAYNDPNAESDLGVYRRHYGLTACTTLNRCFRKVGQTGGAVPANNGGWAQEISLDLDMVSAACPRCHILLIEASTATDTNLAAAVNEAVRLGATEVSNSYGGGEIGASNAAYAHSGVVITASAGDSGAGASQPCSYATVVCVGGTTLRRASSARGWSETAWSGTGSGCSAYVAKPSWQTDRGCRHRSEADVSAIADPNTGVAVYDSYSYQGYSGWLVFGGTSAASPLIASVYALAGNARLTVGAKSLWLHRGTSALNDVTSGSNGSCPVAYPYICRAGIGYDGPTGVGTPEGIGAF